MGRADRPAPSSSISFGTYLAQRNPAYRQVYRRAQIAPVERTDQTAQPTADTQAFIQHRYQRHFRCNGIHRHTRAHGRHHHTDDKASARVSSLRFSPLTSSILTYFVIPAVYASQNRPPLAGITSGYSDAGRRANSKAISSAHPPGKISDASRHRRPDTLAAHFSCHV